MNHKLIWSLNQEYYEEYWNEFVGCRSLFRKWVIPLNISLMIFGILLAVGSYLHQLHITAIVGVLLFSLGPINIVWHYLDKKKWFKLVTSGPEFNGEVVLEMMDEKILHKGPTAKGEMSWSAINTISKSKRGAFLVLQKGISIYIPEKSFNQESQLQEIIKYHESKTA